MPPPSCEGGYTRGALAPPVLASVSRRAHTSTVSTERDGRAPLPLGLLAATRVAVMGLMLVAILAPSVTLAGKSSSSGLQKSTSHTTTPKKPKAKTKRSLKAKHDFKHLHPCPSTGK